MTNAEAPSHTIGDEIPYRRDRIEKKTGSLVFDQHLKGTLSDAPTQSEADDMPDQESPLKRGQVT